MMSRDHAASMREWRSRPGVRERVNAQRRQRRKPLSADQKLTRRARHSVGMRDPAYAAAKREARRRSRNKPGMKKKRWIYALWHTYGITLGQYNALFAHQHGICVGCDNAPAVCIDHDHDCCPGKKSCGGCIRGLLCTPCNLHGALDSLIPYAIIGFGAWA